MGRIWLLLQLSKVKSCNKNFENKRNKDQKLNEHFMTRTYFSFSTGLNN